MGEYGIYVEHPPTYRLRQLPCCLCLPDRYRVRRRGCVGRFEIVICTVRSRMGMWTWCFDSLGNAVHWLLRLGLGAVTFDERGRLVFRLPLPLLQGCGLAINFGVRAHGRRRRHRNEAEVAIYHVQAHQELRFQSSGRAASRRWRRRNFGEASKKLQWGRSKCYHDKPNVNQSP